MHGMAALITFSGLRLDSFCNKDYIQVVEVSPMEWNGCLQVNGQVHAKLQQDQEVMDAVWKHSTLFWILFLLH